MSRTIKVIKKYIHGFMSLLYPEFCAACEAPLYNQEKAICTKCEYEMPRTHFHKVPGNPLEEVFWGRVKIENATALFYYMKESKYQGVIHKLKYHSRKDIGIEMGRKLGIQLKETESFSSVNYIIPVPLHPKKQNKRGYNQSEQIAIGIAEYISAKLEVKTLYRNKHTETQTKKGRYERWENTETVFDIKPTEKLKNSHVLLVDDIITTGATTEACINATEACINALQKIEGIRISVVCLGFARF